MRNPDYSKYSIQELLECKAHIDKEAWPERYKEILKCIDLKNQNSDEKRTHDAIVFGSFCEGLRDDLTFAMDDNFISLFSIFSKKARNTIPSTFEGETCPICDGDLSVKQRFNGWQLSCSACNISGIVTEKSSSF